MVKGAAREVTSLLRVRNSHAENIQVSHQGTNFMHDVHEVLMPPGEVCFPSRNKIRYDARDRAIDREKIEFIVFDVGYVLIGRTAIRRRRNSRSLRWTGVGTKPYETPLPDVQRRAFTAVGQRRSYLNVEVFLTVHVPEAVHTGIDQTGGGRAVTPVTVPQEPFTLLLHMEEKFAKTHATVMTLQELHVNQGPDGWVHHPRSHQPPSAIRITDICDRTGLGTVRQTRAEARIG
jgi:hypothetical protein